VDTLGLYISIPFCRSKCSYCNFASGVYPASYFARYVERLIGELAAARTMTTRLGLAMPQVVDSIYLGGGTPSILPSHLLRDLFHAIRTEFDLAADAEITLECAPGQIEDVCLDAMIACGANRVSFGVQSFVDLEAKSTGRLHDRGTALADIERVRNAGIARVSVDLIAGLPHQDANSWRESLQVLAGTGVDHASVYMLEVDEDSRLGRELLAGGSRYHAGTVAGDDLTAEMYGEAIGTLAKAGLAQYEISNFARSGAASRHNCKYWGRQPYLGLGIDAHSMLRMVQGRAVRFQTGDDLQQFLGGSSWTDARNLSPAEELEEAWFLGLRLNDGVDLKQMCAEFGLEQVSLFKPVLDELEEWELITCERDRVQLTTRGRLMSNEVFERFLGVHTEAQQSDWEMDEDRHTC
jgi:oxygen-independent coproporphyrinogen-3 oxidase